MDIFLVRHGTASASWEQHPDPGLSALGYEEAERLAKDLLPRLEKSVKMLSSPLLRAQETANPLALKLGQNVHIDEALAEIPSPANLADRKTWLREFMKQRWIDQSSEILTWRSSAMCLIESLQTSSVLFTHFLLINAVVGQINKAESTLYFWPANCSITHLRLKGSDLELVSLGEQIRSVIN